MIPAELQNLLDQINTCEREAERLVADLDDAAVNRKPANGGWSVAQCLHHLAVMNEFYLRGCLERVRRSQGVGRRCTGLRPTLLGRWFVRSLEPPVKVKTKARPQGVPAPALPRDEIMPLFKASHAGYRELVAASAETDTNRVIIPNPFFPRIKMRMSTVLLVIPAHDRRHLWQAANVKRSLRAG